MEVPAGEVHAIMGPNGSGKSTLANLIMGRPGYVVTGGSVRIEQDGLSTELLGLPTWKRAQAGVFLAMQSPVEVPGVAIEEVLAASFKQSGRDGAGIASALRAEAKQIGLAERLLDRSMNVELSGGERKRNETVQLAVLQPAFAILDEIDSGLDVDALRAVSRRVETATTDTGLGVLAITHFSRLLTELRADCIHVLWQGRLVASGGPELAATLEEEGYGAFTTSDLDQEGKDDRSPNPSSDPFSDPLA